jgi:hypothetical protein
VFEKKMLFTIFNLFFFWAIFEISIQILKVEYALRLNAFIHSVRVSVLSLMVIYYLPWYFDENIHNRDHAFYIQETTQKITDFTVGYAIVDIWKGYRYKNLETSTLIHHIAMLVAIGWSVIFHYEWFLILAITSEVTTPFLHIAYWCKEEKKTKNLFFKIISVVLLILFLIFRVVNFWFITWYAFYFRQQLIIGIPMGVLFIQNVWWFYLLVTKALKYMKK